MNAAAAIKQRDARIHEQTAPVTLHQGDHKMKGRIKAPPRSEAVSCSLWKVITTKAAPWLKKIEGETGGVLQRGEVET